ncbi:hypothetical protein Gotur_014426 [Gossypium turneri]
MRCRGKYMHPMRHKRCLLN